MRRAPRTSGGGRRPAAGTRAGQAITAALCAAAIVCAGCGAATAPRAPLIHEGVGDGVTARLSLSPEPAPVMRPVRLSVSLVDARGRAVAGRAVTFDLSMPGMAMAPNSPKVSATGDGVFEATTLLSMAGEWRLTVGIGGPGPALTVPLTFSAR